VAARQGLLGPGGAQQVRGAEIFISYKFENFTLQTGAAG